jgi:FMN phosphatase YigB (HAD superfamily)
VRFELVSFDVQGTLTDAAYCDAFWLRGLGEQYAQGAGCSVEEGQAYLRQLFTNLGKEDRNYYDTDRWVAEFYGGRPLSAVMAGLGVERKISEDLVQLVDELGAQTVVIAVSSTTHSFLDLELEGLAHKFMRVFSTFDDLSMAGKPTEVFTLLSSMYGVAPSRCVHIGDKVAEDVESPRAAGWGSFHWQGDVAKLRAYLDLRGEA